MVFFNSYDFHWKIFTHSWKNDEKTVVNDIDSLNNTYDFLKPKSINTYNFYNYISPFPHSISMKFTDHVDTIVILYTFVFIQLNHRN